VFVSVRGNNPPKKYQTSDVANLITASIDGGTLPEPDEETRDVLHVVFMPPGTTAPPNLGGLHTYASYTDYDFPFDFDINDRSHMAWVAFGSRASISSLFSHELVEALTDPEGDGIQVNPTNPSNWNEIGDVCSTRGVVNGVTTQSYWSQQDQACVIPANIPLQMQITCINMTPSIDPYPPIREVGGINRTQNIPFRMSQADCINSIDRGNRFFVMGPGGSQADVHVYVHFPPWSLQGIRYIATNPDNPRSDSLHSLPECPIAPPPPPRVTVPEVLEERSAVAVQRIIASHLVPRLIGSPAGNAWVHSQSPAAGTRVSPGRIVTLQMRTGPIP
jgi:hypothetical protein